MGSVRSDALGARNIAALSCGGCAREHRKRAFSQRVMERARGERERIGWRGAGAKRAVASEVVSSKREIMWAGAHAGRGPPPT